MAKISILQGATSVTVNIFIADSSSTTGAGLTGLVFNTSSLTCYYMRPKVAATAVTLATLAAVTTAYSSGGFKEIDATNAPGWYRFDIPDAAIANAERFCSFHFKGATNMAPLPLEVELTAVNNQSATTFMTSVASVTGAVGSVTGLTASNLDTTVSSRMASYTQPTGFLAATFPTGTVANTTNVTAGTITTVTNLTNAPTAGDLTATMKTSVTTAATAATPTAAAVTGAVGSVTGAVGSVTGLTAANLDATISSRMASYTQPTGFLAATFPGGTVASTNNIVAGTIATVTNLTNAPGAGDLTPTMKTSVTTAATAATPIAASVTGAVGSLVGSAGIKKNTAKSAFMFPMTDATTHAPAPGLSPAGARSLNGGAFSATTNAPTEISAGWYKIDLSAADLNGDTVALKFTATGADQVNIALVTGP